MRQLAAVAEIEALRIVRRGETLVLFLVAAILFLAPFVLLERGQVRFHGAMDLPIRVQVEAVFRLLRIVEAILLAGTAYVLASSSLGRELERGTLPLLVLGPIRFRTILLGKAAAVLFVTLCLHGFASAALASPLPVLRESIAEWLVRFLGVWLFAASFIADGLVHSGLRHASGRRGLAFRIASLLRIVAAGQLLVAFLRPEAKAFDFGLFDLVVHGVDSTFAGEPIPVAALFVSPRLAAAASLLWLAGSGIALASWFFRRASR